MSVQPPIATAVFVGRPLRFVRYRLPYPVEQDRSTAWTEAWLELQLLDWRLLSFMATAEFDVAPPLTPFRVYWPAYAHLLADE